MAYRNKEKEKAWIEAYKPRRRELGRIWSKAHRKPRNGDYSRKRLYNLSPEHYQSLLEKQSGLCAICLKPPKSKKGFHVDHDHKTGKVRGILCAGCNRDLAALDNKDWFVSAKRYLEENS